MFKLGMKVRHNSVPVLGEGTVVDLKNKQGQVVIKFPTREWTTRHGYFSEYTVIEPEKEVEKPPFKVGDRVRTSFGEGVVKAVNPQGHKGWLAVETAKPYFGHDCDGHTKSGYGAWCLFDTTTLIEPAKPEDIMFKVGNRIRVKDSKIGFTGIATVAAVDDRGIVFLYVSDEAYLEPFDGYWGQRYHDLGLDTSKPIYTTNTYYHHLYEVVQEVTPPAPKKAAPSKTFKADTQCGLILAHLASGKTLTRITADHLYRVASLTRRILDLREAGHKINSTTKVDATGRTYVEYSMRKAGR